MTSIFQDKNLKNINTVSQIKQFIKTSNIDKIIPKKPHNMVLKNKDFFKKKNLIEINETEIRNKVPSYSSSKNTKINEKNVVVYQLNLGKDKKIIKHKTNSRTSKRKILKDNIHEKNIEKEQQISKNEKNSYVSKKVTEDISLSNTNISNSIRKNNSSVVINNISKEVKKYIPKKKVLNEGIKDIKSSFIHSHIANNIPNNNNFSNKSEFILLPNLKCKRRKTSAQSKQLQYISVGLNKENNNILQHQENRENNFKQMITFSKTTNEIPEIKNQNITNQIAKNKNRNKYCLFTKNSKEKKNKITKKEIKVVINIKDISNSSTICASNSKNINRLIKSTSDGYYSQVHNKNIKNLSHNNSNLKKNYIKKIKIVKSKKIINSPKTSNNINNNNYNSSNNNNFSTNNSSPYATTSQKNNLSFQLLKDPYKFNKILSQSSKSIIQNKIQSVRESIKMQLNNNINNSTTNFTCSDKQTIHNINNNNSSKWDNKCYIPIVSASLVCGNIDNSKQNTSLNLQYKNKCNEDSDIIEHKRPLGLSYSNSFRDRRNQHKTERSQSINCINRGDNRLSLDYSLCLQEKKLDKIHDELKNYGVLWNKKNDEHSVDFTLANKFFNKTFNHTKSLKDIYNGRRSGLLNEMRKIKYENYNSEEY